MIVIIGLGCFMAGGFVGIFVGIWLVAGDEPDHFDAFMRDPFVHGYVDENDALGENWPDKV